MGGEISSAFDSVAGAVVSVADSVASTVVSVGSTAISSVSEVANTTISYAGSYTNTALSSISGPVLSSLTAVADTGGGIAIDYGNGIIAYNSGLVINWSTQQIGSGLDAYYYLIEKGLAIPLSLQQYDVKMWVNTVVGNSFVTNLSDSALVSIQKTVSTFQNSAISFVDKASGIVVYANGFVVDFATGTMGSSMEAVMFLASKGIALTTLLQQVYDDDLKQWSGNMYNFAKNMSVKSALTIKNIIQNAAGSIVKVYELEGIVVGANGWVIDMANAAASQGMDAGLYLWRKGLEVPAILMKYIPLIPQPPLCKKCERCPTCN